MKQVSQKHRLWAVEYSTRGNMNNIKFIFVRDHNNFPVGCFAYRDAFTGDAFTLKFSGVGEIDGMNYGYSIYYFGDKFNRALARQVAQARLEKNPRTIYGKLPQREMVLEMLRLTGKTEIHQWASVEGEPRPLGYRFRGACVRAADKLAKVIKRGGHLHPNGL